VADNGEWLMIAPSGKTMIICFCITTYGQHLHSNVIKTKHKGPEVQQTCLSLNNSGEAFAGVLVNAGSATGEKGKGAHYSMPKAALAYDTTYRFNTLAVIKAMIDTSLHKPLCQYPGKGSCS
jgi:hypothetical protein